MAYHISYTVYSRQGENNRKDGSVGINFPPAPSLTKTEVHDLIDQLQAIAQEMARSA